MGSDQGAKDDELGEELDELRRQRGQGGRVRLPGKIHFDLPARVGIDFARAFYVRLVEQTTASWEFWFGLLERFTDEHGHARVPSLYTADDYRLGRWVTTQRFRRSRLDDDRIRRLQNLPGWTWDPRADQWDEGFSHLLDYVDEQNRRPNLPPQPQPNQKPRHLLAVRTVDQPRPQTTTPHVIDL